MAWKNLLQREYLLPERVYIFDTTLRDGEQTPGAALKPEDKIRVAEALDELGVDIIEAGFPLVSKGEAEAVKTIANMKLKAKICALARAEKMDIDAALNADVDWIHVFIATSDIHLKHKLRLTREEALEKARSMVEYAKEHGVTVHFSAEDATRTEPSFLMRVFREVEKAGADSIDIPDTVGTALPYAMRYLVRLTKENVKVPVSVHCHDDFGLAVANSLAGVEAGAEIIHATINGIGERAGNASLEEIVSALNFLYGVKTNIRLENLYKTSRLVEKLTGIIVPKNKAIVGDNAFSHESGIHVHGILGSPHTYEPVMPESFGRRRRIVFGKHSGAHGVEALLKEYGFTVEREKLRKILARIKEIGDSGGRVSEEDVLSIATQVYGKQTLERSSIRRLSISKVDGEYDAACELIVAHEIVAGRGAGSNPVTASLRAALKAVESIADVQLVDYKVLSGMFDERHPAEAEVILRIKDTETVGRGLDKDPAAAITSAVASAVHQLLLSQSNYMRVESGHRDG
ncbi:MAG: 2-isopropylmalate synthase [Aigarchaeota archaeon]|nr:2-isopropylmalate synthase [Candidatus Pelearchaeum maunauluense]